LNQLRTGAHNLSINTSVSVGCSRYVISGIFFSPISVMWRQGTTHMIVSFLAYAQPIPFLPHRLMDSVSGSLLEMSNGEVVVIGGNRISCNAFVGHEPMHERQPTHCVARTTTGRFLCFLSVGFSARGKRASKGQCGMHKSQPVQSASVMATMDCPMSNPRHWSFSIQAFLHEVKLKCHLH